MTIASVTSAWGGLPMVSILIPTYRRPGILRETLRGVAALDYPRDRFEAIVVDDGSGDETPDVVASFAEPGFNLTGIHQENAGGAKARNQGARRARGEVLLFLDDDMILPPSAVSAHLATLAHFGRCLVCGYREYAPDLEAELRRTPFGRFRLDTEPRQEGWDLGRSPRGSLEADCVDFPTISSCNLSIRRDDFFEIGGFDEGFPSVGYEDQELALRALALGFRCLVNYGIKSWNNDRSRMSFRAFCDRQRRIAFGGALFAAKYPDRLSQALVTENTGVRSGDSPGLIVKKIVKVVLGSRPVLVSLHAAIDAQEAIWPSSPMLPRLYHGVCGLWIYRGIRQGFAHLRDVAHSSPGRPTFEAASR